ncbi:MAG: hypothetical protein QW736_04455 [Fervidicoccaceae archaeon]
MRRDLLKDIAIEVDCWKNPVGSVDIIGDIAILRIPTWIYRVEEDCLSKIADSFLKRIPYIKSVWLSASPVLGEKRTRELKHLAGERRTETIYREHGISFLVDISKSYVSPRLSYEHLRIAKLVRDGEVVTNFFSGIGGFSLVIAKNSGVRLVNSIDINKDAVEMQRKSIELNGLEGKVRVFLGDAREISRLFLKGSSDRVLFPLPGIDESFYRAAVEVLRGNEGYFHVYEFVNVKQSEDEAIERKFDDIGKTLLRLGWRSELVFFRKVRSVGPRKIQVAMDIFLRRI